MQNQVWQRLKPYLDQYDLKVLDASAKASDVYLLDGGRKHYEGRFAPEAVASVKMRIGDYAAGRRFRRTPRFLLNLYHVPMISAPDGNVFYLTEDWSGVPLQMTPADVEHAAVNLAQLHRALDGGGEYLKSTRLGNKALRHDSPPAQSEMAERLFKPRYGTWITALSRGADRFSAERFVEVGHTFGPAWNDWLKRWEDQAKQSVVRLKDAGYEHIAQESSAHTEVVWNDYRLENLHRLDNGRIATLQPSSPVFDTALYDLATLCCEICSRGHEEGVKEAVDRYSEMRPLTPEQKQVVIAFAVYPHTPLSWIQQLRHTGATAVPTDWQRRAEVLRSAANALLQSSFG